jgi:hypothetical protein
MPPSQEAYYAALQANLAEATRFVELSDLLYNPPRSDPYVMHEHREGVFRLFEQATNLVILLALRRCVDKGQSMGLGAMNKGAMPTALCSASLDKIQTLIDQSLAHTDPRSKKSEWWEKAAVTHRDVRTLLEGVRREVALVAQRAGLVQPEVEVEDIREQFDRLVDDIHLASQMRLLKDRAADGLPISSSDVLHEHRPTQPR